jgi:transcriptional regulator GlxA family with amidase domain
MKLAFIVFDGITWLDLIGVYDAIIRLKMYGYIPDLSWDICCYTETATDPLGLQMIPTKINTTLEDYDALIVPGGHGTRNLQSDEGFMDWIKTAKKVPCKISICTGSLILGAAGFLKGKKATTHYQEYESLKPYCAEVREERIVEDENIITAGAVSSSLDLGLFLCNKWAGEEAASVIRKKMDYRG